MVKRTDPTLAPERIWLLLHEGEGGSHVWCDDPDPTGNGEHDAVEYVRADLAKLRWPRKVEPRPGETVEEYYRRSWGLVP